MERRVSTIRFCAIAACLAGGAAISCGTGIHDGRGEVFATSIIGPSGGQILLREATLDIGEDSVQGEAPITLRRYDSIAHSGAVGPVFEIQVPTPDTFTHDPHIGIATAPAVVASAKSVIGFLIPGVPNEQWIPDSTTSTAPCPGSDVCGPVQKDTFFNPGGSIDAGFTTTVLRLAIVTQCAGNADCLSRQACTSRACQKCPPNSPCNP